MTNENMAEIAEQIGDAEFMDLITYFTRYSIEDDVADIYYEYGYVSKEKLFDVIDKIRTKMVDLFREVMKNDILSHDDIMKWAKENGILMEE